MNTFFSIQRIIRDRAITVSEYFYRDTQKETLNQKINSRGLQEQWECRIHSHHRAARIHNGIFKHPSFIIRINNKS